jgi:hypothetical protein
MRVRGRDSPVEISLVLPRVWGVATVRDCLCPRLSGKDLTVSVALRSRGCVRHRSPGCGGDPVVVELQERLWVAATRRHSDCAAALPRLRNRVIPRLYLICPNTGSMLRRRFL